MAERSRRRPLSPFRLKRLGFYLIFTRFAFLVFLFVITYSLKEFDSRTYPDWLPLVPTAAIAFNFVLYFLNFVFGSSRLFHFFQLVSDLAFISVLVFYTGGVDSNFIFLYYALIIGCAALMSDWSSLVFASAATVLISAKTMFTLLKGGSMERLKTIIALLFAQSIGMHLAAYLSSLLAINLYREKVFNEEILENIEDALLVLSPNGKVVFMNPAAMNLLGLSEKAIGKACSEVFARPGLEPLQRFLSEGGTGQLEMDIEPTPGILLPVNVRVSNIRGAGSGRPARVVLIEELTIKRRLQEIESRSRRLQEYSVISAGVAHEIRNPLASIKAAAHEIERDITDPELRAMMDIIIKESDRLNTILTEFLYFTRSKEPVFESTELYSLCEDVRTLVLAGDVPPADYELDIERGLKCRLDREQFKQVLLNLSLNSVEAGGREVRIRVSARRESSDEFLRKHRKIAEGVPTYSRAGVTITHEDDGPGVREEERKDIFVPFFTTKPKGTGLGLAVVQRVVAAHGGIVLADFDRPKGVAFRIWLPQAGYLEEK